MVDRFEQFTAMISAGHRFVQKIAREEMEQQGLKGAFAQYLLAISHFPAGLTAAELCEVCDRDKAAVSRILSEMERKGLVCRTDSSYRAKITLTPQGQQAVQFVQRRATVAVELVGRDLSGPDRQTFYAALDKITANLEALCKTGLPEE